MQPPFDPPSAGVGPSQPLGSRPVVFVAALTLLVAGAGVVAAGTAYVGKAGQHAGSAPSAGSAGCVLIHTQYGYPDRYLAKRVEYTKHPPLPVPGWRGRDESVLFPMLFHSLFHGYIVVEYHADLSARTLAMLKAWVQGNAARRVTSTPAAAGEPFAVDVARWGYELRCSREGALTRRSLDRFLALGPRS